MAGENGEDETPVAQKLPCLNSRRSAEDAHKTNNCVAEQKKRSKK